MKILTCLRGMYSRVVGTEIGKAESKFICFLHLIHRNDDGCVAEKNEWRGGWSVAEQVWRRRKWWAAWQSEMKVQIDEDIGRYDLLLIQLLAWAGGSTAGDEAPGRQKGGDWLESHIWILVADDAEFKVKFQRVALPGLLFVFNARKKLWFDCTLIALSWHDAAPGGTWFTSWL